MKRIVIALVPVLLFSCQPSKKDMLVRNWHAVNLYNPELDDMLQKQQLFIDTVGKSTSPPANDSIYGFHNMDSIKVVLQKQLDSFKLMQQQTLENTYFNFKKNGQAILTFSGYTDTTKWYFDDEGALMLDELKEKGAGTSFKMIVQHLSDTALKLKFIEKDVSSIVTFHPVKN
ncbi:MAG: hypothetical protein ACTHJ0_07445 [Flavipsychrobacter sp.]